MDVSKGKKVPDKENPIDLGWQLHLKRIEEERGGRIEDMWQCVCVRDQGKWGERGLPQRSSWEQKPCWKSEKEREEEAIEGGRSTLRISE